MNFRPCFDESLLRSRKTAADELDRIDGEHSRRVLIVSVKVRAVVRCADLHEHSNDDSKKSGNLRHRYIRVPSESSCRANAALQPRRFTIPPSADGCKRLLAPKRRHLVKGKHDEGENIPVFLLSNDSCIGNQVRAVAL